MQVQNIEMYKMMLYREFNASSKYWNL